MAVYLITSEIYKAINKYKFGRTISTRSEIQSKYQRYHDYATVIGWYPVKDPVKVETDILRLLDKYRGINPNGNKNEWITMNIDELTAVIDKYLFENANMIASDNKTINKNITINGNITINKNITYSNSGKIQCPNCKQIMSTKQGLQRHLMKKIKCKEIFKCNSCNKEFNQKRDFERHNNKKNKCKLIQDERKELALEYRKIEVREKRNNEITKIEQEKEKRKLEKEKRNNEIIKIEQEKLKLKQLELENRKKERELEYEKEFQRIEKLKLKQLKLEFEKEKFELQKTVEKRRYEQHINIQTNCNNTQNNISIIIGPPNPDVKPFNRNTSEEIIGIFNSMMFEEFNNIIGGPESSRDHKLISLMGWAHNNDVLSEFKNVRYNNNKFYIPKEDEWIEIDYQQVKDILVHEVLQIIVNRKVECFEKGEVGTDGPNVYKKMIFALLACIDVLCPEKNFKRFDIELENIINTALKLSMDIKEYTSIKELSSGASPEEFTF